MSPTRPTVQPHARTTIGASRQDLCTDAQVTATLFTLLFHCSS
uniref:Uncharacterized protein n=1 Tax=Arundo donax TaxID=35708 RepID=A0A0A8YBM1_ARUDO